MSLQPAFRRSILLALTSVTLAFGWWPFSFSQRNDVVWMPAEKALRFNGIYEMGDTASRGAAYGAELLDTRNWPGITLLVELRGRAKRSGLGVFLEFYEEGAEGLPSLLIAQWQEHLAMRSKRDTARVERGYSEIGHKGTFASGDFIVLQVASEGERTHVTVDGDVVSTRRDFPLLGDQGGFNGRLVIGNSADGTRPFTGDIRRIRIYDRFYKAGSAELAAARPVLDFDFRVDGKAAGVVVPERYAMGKRLFFGAIDAANLDKESYKSDVVVNALGFIPVGLCFAAVARRRVDSLVGVLLFVGAASLGLSSLIEWGQGFLVHRDSSLQDVLLNTMSGIVAVAVPRKWTLYL